MKYHIRCGGELVCVTSAECTEEKAEEIRGMYQAQYPGASVTKRKKEEKALVERDRKEEV